MFVNQITDRTSQSLAILELLFSTPEQSYFAQEIANRAGITRELCTRLAHLMSRRGIVRTRRGPGGGAVLLNPECTLWDVIVAVENPVKHVHSEPWQHLAEYIERTLKRTKVKDLLKGET